MLAKLTILEEKGKLFLVNYHQVKVFRKEKRHLKNKMTFRRYTIISKDFFQSFIHRLSK